MSRQEEFKISKETMDRLDVMAKETGAFKSALVELALVAHLDRYFSHHYAKHRKKLIELARQNKKLIARARRQSKLKGGSR